MPDEQHQQRTDHAADQAGALAGAVPSYGLAEKGRDDGANDAEHGGQDEARRLVWTGRKKARDQAGDETNEDDPQDAHLAPPSAGLYADNNSGRAAVPGRALTVSDGAVSFR